LGFSLFYSSSEYSKIPKLLSMADFDNRVRNVLLEYLSSIESQEPPENGDQGSSEMYGKWAREEEIAPDLGSNGTEIPGYHGFEQSLPVQVMA
jgi:hypothetical protein